MVAHFKLPLRSLFYELLISSPRTIMAFSFNSMQIFLKKMTVSPKKVLDIGCLILRLRGANSLTFYVLFLYFTLFSFFFCSLVFVFIVVSEEKLRTRYSSSPIACHTVDLLTLLWYN